MKIQCSHCKTVYDLDDKKIPNKKIKFKCRKCQNPVYVNKRIEPAAASSQPKQMECPNCGHKQAVSDECIHCGTSVVKHRRAAKPDSEPEPRPQSVPEPQPQQQPVAKNEDAVLCPKCAFELKSGDLECLNCGIVIEKYIAFEAKKKQAEEESQQKAAEASDQEPIPTDSDNTANQEGSNSDQAE